MKQLFFGFFLLPILLCSVQVVEAQQADSSKTAEKEKFSIKFSGYVQALYQKASAKGISSFSGGSFPDGVDQRFTVRRGRLKGTFGNELTKAVLQLDMREKGVDIRHAYITIIDPKLKTFGLQFGVQDRYFGYDVILSSSKREFPERSRLFQSLFSGEIDMGLMLFAKPPETSKFGFLEIALSLFNGSGNTSDYDNNKDFIARVHTSFEGKTSPWELGAGLSYYSGGQGQNSKYVYYIPDGKKSYQVDSSESNIEGSSPREYFGADIQLAYDFSFGKTSLRTEYIFGKQAGSYSSSRTPRSRPEGATYRRKFAGAYATLVQQLGNLPLKALLKYDFYDPNTVISSDEIDNSFSPADIRYHTFAYGLVYSYNKHINLTAVYEDVNNESTLLDGFTKDIDDNVFSLMLQYKF